MPREQRVHALTAIARRSQARRILDRRTPDEIISYDDAGLPG